MFTYEIKNFKCAYDNAKRSFDSAVNGILGKVLNFASEDVIYCSSLSVSACPYGLDACPRQVYAH